MKDKHTEGEWKVFRFINNTVFIIQHEGEDILDSDKIPKETREANAKRIVHIHNTYDELVEGLKNNQEIMKIIKSKHLLTKDNEEYLDIQIEGNEKLLKKAEQ